VDTAGKGNRQALLDEPALRLPGLRLLCHVAAASLGDVYLAVRESDGLPLAVKVLRLGGRTRPVHLERLVREHALLAAVDHPNVIRIHAAGRVEDRAWLAMEYFERGDLRCELGHALAPHRVHALAIQLARALQAIHAAGIVHGDVTPQNVLLRSDGSGVLSDFGIARALDGACGVAVPAAAPERIGTPFYLSPEQARGEPVHPASDLYSLGVMLHEMLTGARPFQADSLELLLARHQSAPAPRLPASQSEWQPILDRLMAKQPADRYPGATALLADLARLAQPLVRPGRG
jgi:serine/threonine protein kinase